MGNELSFWHANCIFPDSEPVLAAMPRHADCPCNEVASQQRPQRRTTPYRNFGQPADFNKEIKMWNEKMKFASIGIMVASLAACGTTGMSGMGQSSSASSIPVTTTTTTSSASGYGVVQSIEAVPQQQVAGVGLGTVAGAVVGGLLGNQVGSGNGRTAATVAGAAGGAMVGNQMQRNSQAAGSGQAYRVTVRMDNGAIQTLAMNTSGGLQVGERVRVQDGNIVERLR